MDAGAVLYIHFVSYSDKIYISPNHRVEPNAGIRLESHAADHDRAVGDRYLRGHGDAE